MTYPDPAVSSFMGASFEALSINMIAPPDDARDLVRSIKPPWSPLFVISSHGIELRRSYGFFDPDDFIAELGLGLGLADLLRGDHDGAHSRFRQIAASGTAGAPEALYWSGASAFRRGGKDFDALAVEWRELMERYPGSPWARRVDVLELLPQKP